MTRARADRVEAMEAGPLEPLLDVRQASAILGVEPRTLDDWAYKGLGPAFIKVGRARRYDPADIRAWIQIRKRLSTGEA